MNAAPLRIVMRADASAEIGLGHVKRCLSLGHALSNAGAHVTLISRDLGVDVGRVAALSSIDSHRLPAPRGGIIADRVPHASWARVGWEQDAEETVAAADALAPDWIVVDHYSFDARWHRKVAPACARLMAIDDLADRELDCAVLVDHNYHSDHRRKYAGVVDARVKLFGGPRFALLAPPYATARRAAVDAEVRSIGIFMGGVDRDDWSSRVLAACRVHAQFTGPIEIATTSSNPNLAALLTTCERWPPTTALVDAAELADFFSRHDLQIGAGGGATWERCCIGAPTLALACADNQRPIVAALADSGAVATVQSAGEPSEEEIGRAIRALVNDPERRQRMSAIASCLVDGLGARRVALHLAGDTIWLRRVDAGDARRIYEWRNHEATRSVSRDPTQIAWSSHVDWLNRVLADDDRLLLLGAVGSIPIGVIRFDALSGAATEVSLYLDPALHSLGLGSALLRAGERHALRVRTGVRRFVAVVLEENVASQRMFEAAGYVREGRVRWGKNVQADGGMRS